MEHFVFTYRWDPRSYFLSGSELNKRATVLKEHVKLFRVLELEFHHWMILCNIKDTLWCGGLNLLQRCGQFILKPQPTGLILAISVLAKKWLILNRIHGGARGVMVIVVGNGHGDTSSNPGRDWLHFTEH